MKKRITNKKGGHTYHNVDITINSSGYFQTITNTKEVRIHHNIFDLMKFLSIAIDGKYIGGQTYRVIDNKWIKTTEDLIPVYIEKDEYYE